MLASFILKYKDKYVKIWNGKSDEVICSKNIDKARIFEIGWLRGNSNKIKELEMKIIPIHKKIWSYGIEFDVENLNNNDPYKENQCVCCGTEVPKEKIYYMADRGYGSYFDNMSTKIPLCDSCKPKEFEEWINETPIIEGYCETYKLEEKLNDWFSSLSVQGRELIFNHYSSDSYTTNSNHWIIMEKSLAKHEIYKENCRYSPAEVHAYYTKFPTCKEVMKREYKDGSKGSYCNLGAHGSVDKNNNIIAGLNVCDDCMTCEHFN